MEYQKIINLLENTPNQPSEFRTKRWVEVKMNHGERIMLIVKLNLKLHLVEFSKSLLSFLIITSSLLKCFIITSLQYLLSSIILLIKL